MHSARVSCGHLGLAGVIFVAWGAVDWGCQQGGRNLNMLRREVFLKGGKTYFCVLSLKKQNKKKIEKLKENISRRWESKPWPEREITFSHHWSRGEFMLRSTGQSYIYLQFFFLENTYIKEFLKLRWGGGGPPFPSSSASACQSLLPRCIICME